MWRKALLKKPTQEKDRQRRSHTLWPRRWPKQIQKTRRRKACVGNMVKTTCCACHPSAKAWYGQNVTLRPKAEEKPRGFPVRVSRPVEAVIERGRVPLVVDLQDLVDSVRSLQAKPTRGEISTISLSALYTALHALNYTHGTWVWIEKRCLLSGPRMVLPFYPRKTSKENTISGEFWCCLKTWFCFWNFQWY